MEGIAMTALDWTIIAAGIAAIAWVNWYFLLAERRVGRKRESTNG
jgi:hypothetical protein